MFDEPKMFARYAAGLGGYLRRPLGAVEAQQLITCQLARRTRTFLDMVQRGIYQLPSSPYRRLLMRLGIAFGDIEREVQRVGLETTLEQLHDDGVYVTVDEFKGRRPIVRPGLEIPVRPEDFDNPLLKRHYEARTGGSRGAVRRIPVDFDLLTHEAAYMHFMLAASDLFGRPYAIWRAVPPVTVGIIQSLRHAKIDRPILRWFSTSKPSFRPSLFKFALFTGYSLVASRLVGNALPVPRYVPHSRAEVVADWLARCKAAGICGVLDTTSSLGVRVCLAAMERSIDISGSFFRLGSEPYTEARATVVREAGCEAISHYAMAEIGNIGLGCPRGIAEDDNHLLTDKISVIQRAKQVGSSPHTVGMLVFSTLLPSCPKLMLNVQSDDYGVLERRPCGCPLGELGFDQHLHAIRSYEKLTSEGVSFLGTELFRLLEEVLPATFGGRATDYQLVEEEKGGLPRVSLLVNPRLGELEPREVLATVYAHLESYQGGEVMAHEWRQAQTLRVVRRPPHLTQASKILPLHIVGVDHR